ncbi:MAG: uncharacterized protein H6Q59_837 [Firmicutes bacterium]|nr:uncharacterized protein [Bacillota bacterium]
MKKSFLVLFIIISLLGLTACDKLDVIGDQSEKSFDEVLNVMKSKVALDDTFEGWSITSPDKETRFLWSKDFSKTTTDAYLEVDAQPFIDAGLDITKLPEGMVVGDKIIVGTDLGDENITYVGEASPLDSYKKLVKHYRDNISYHAALDHYGVKLGNGNMFEWAKDMKTNDKDIVFVLNPQPFLDAGVNPAKLESWVFAKVETMDDNGKKIQVDKFLKPFDLES